MGNLRCPRCSNVVAVTLGVRPVCARCGHGSPDGLPPHLRREPVVRPHRGPRTEVKPPPVPPPPPLPDPYRYYEGGPDSAPPPPPSAPKPRERTKRKKRRGPVGKDRPFVLVFILNLITFGVYGVYYWWKTFREVDHHAGFRHASGLYVASYMFIGVAVAATYLLPPGYLLLGFFGAGILAAFIAGLAYMAKCLGHLKKARRRSRLRPGIGFGGFLLWNTFGLVLAGLGPLIAWGLINKSMRTYWHRHRR